MMNMSALVDVLRELLCPICEFLCLKIDESYRKKVKT